MPIFEYKCQKCGHDFEELVLTNGKIKCPKCATLKVEKKFSPFSRIGRATKPGSSPAGCGGCTSSNCGSCGL